MNLIMFISIQVIFWLVFISTPIWSLLISNLFILIQEYFQMRDSHLRYLSPNPAKSLPNFILSCSLIGCQISLLVKRNKLRVYSHHSNSYYTKRPVLSIFSRRSKNWNWLCGRDISFKPPPMPYDFDKNLSCLWSSEADGNWSPMCCEAHKIPVSSFCCYQIRFCFSSQAILLFRIPCFRETPAMDTSKNSAKYQSFARYKPPTIRILLLTPLF